MEPTTNFAAALAQANAEMDNNAVGSLLGRRKDVAKVHRKVRALYANGRRLRAIDWSKLVDWLKEHWDEILKIILIVAPLLI